MNRVSVNLLLDGVLAAVLFVMTATGYILNFVLPAGSNRTHVLWGTSRHGWGTLHGWAATIFLVLLLAHLVLHWEWICSTLRRRISDRLSARVLASFIVGTFVLLFAAFSVAAHWAVRDRDTPLHPMTQSGQAPDAGPDVLGSPKPDHEDRQVQEVQALFQKSCLECHGPEEEKGAFRVDRAQDFTEDREGGPLVVPGDPRASRLIQIISGRVKGMKAARAHQLEPGEIALVEAWIRAGAHWRQ